MLQVQRLSYLWVGGNCVLENVCLLNHDEPLILDCATLGRLYAEMGEVRADAALARALAELANRLAVIERSFYDGDIPVLAKSARGLVAITEQIGLQTLAQVAGDVAYLAQRRDLTALAAALARLVRLGDQSITAIWDVQDMNGAV